MEIKNRNASASIFGWQFQINVAIYLMFKYFKNFEEIKVEGSNEDIEILLANKRKIYAQAKSKKDINVEDTSSYSTKLKEALDSLSDVKAKNIENLIYISNLEPNPLNSGTDEFKLITFLKYDELRPESREKIDNQLKNLKKDIDKSKIIIAKIPFFGEDKSTRQKFVMEQLEKFLAYTKSDLLPYSKRLLEMWESDFIHNASQTKQALKIKKDDVLWNLLVFELEKNNSNSFDPTMEIDEEDYQLAIEKYDKVITHKEGNFRIFNKITILLKKAKERNPNIRIDEFINMYTEEIYDIVFENSKNKEEELIEIACSKIVAKRISLRNKTAKEMFRRAGEYEN